MPLLSFNGDSYDVHHAVKGTDYIHGYDADGTEIVKFDGVSDFSAFTYSGEYMSPENCAEEGCNIVKHVAGVLMRSDGGAITLPGFETGTYTGTGPQNDVVITTKQKPEVLFLCSHELLIYFNPSTSVWGPNANWGEEGLPKTIIWGDNSVTLAGNPSAGTGQGSLWNYKGDTYKYIVLTK